MTWWHYLLLVNFYLVLFFGFYALLLRRETFFQLNRIYLVSASLLSFLIPLIQSNWVKNLFITQQVQHTIYNSPAINPVMVYHIIPAESSLTIGQLLTGVYISVTFFLILRLMWQLVILKKAIEKPSPSAAYSFFKKISLGSRVENHDIINAHEQVHARQWHSVDVMIIETVMIINWFNPVVYLYRFAIKYIHEFIADKQVIQAGTDKADYALLLLSQTFDVPAHSLVTSFYNHTLLRERIQMLQKSRSHRIALAKYGLSAPLFMLMLVLSSATVNNSKAIHAINKKAEKVLSSSAENLTASITDHGEIPENTLPPAVDPYVESYIKSTQLKIDTAELTGKESFTSVESPPQFPGSLADFLRTNIKYPAAMHQANVQGKAVVQFIVETNGSITNIRSISDPGYGSGEEAERVMALSPKWTPAYQNGKPIKAMYTIPISFTLNNTQNTAAASANRVFSVVEKQPQFPGGIEKFFQFLQQNMRYPEAMRQANVQGRVIVQFVVEADGTLSNIQAVRSPGYGAGEEAVRVLTASPKWVPGSQNGKPVRVAYTVPVSFSLDKADEIVRNTVVDTNSTKNALKLLENKNNPLFVIDGITKDKASFTRLSPSDITSVKVLMDSSAEAYGATPKQPVVLVTTKKSKSLAPNLLQLKP